MESWHEDVSFYKIFDSQGYSFLTQLLVAYPVKYLETLCLHYLTLLVDICRSGRKHVVLQLIKPVIKEYTIYCFNGPSIQCIAIFQTKK